MDAFTFSPNPEAILTPSQNESVSRFFLLDRICAKLRRGWMELSQVRLLLSAQFLSHHTKSQLFNLFLDSELHKFVDEGLSGDAFINAVSGIVNRGCHK